MMSAEAAIALGIGVIWIIISQIRKPAARQQRASTTIAVAVPVGVRMSTLRILIGWLINIVGFNILAALCWLGIDHTVTHDLSGFRCLGYFFGWVFLWSYVVERLALPRPYRQHLDAQQTYSCGPSCGYFIIAICWIGWMLACISRMWTWTFS